MNVVARLVLLLACLSLMPVAHAEEKVAPWKDAATVEALFEEACDLVEKLSGAPFDKRPKVLLSTEKTVFELLEDDLDVLVKLGYTPADVQLTRRVFASALVGKYDAQTHAVHIVPATIERVIESSKALAGALTRDQLRLLLVHEAAHAHDFPRYDLLKVGAALESRDALQAFGAVVEGHAEWRTLQAARHWNIEPALERMRNALLSTGLDEPEDATIATGVIMASLRFAYGQGRRFFEAVHAARGDDGVEAVLRTPPRRIAVIERPTLWLKPDAAADEVDLRPLIEALQPLVGREPWTAQSQAVLAAQLKSMSASLPEADRVGFLDGLDSARVLVGVVPEEEARFVAVLMAFDATPNAEAYVRVDEALRARKWKALDKDAVESRIVRAGVGSDQKIPGAWQHLRLREGREVADIRQMSFRIGRVCGEFLIMQIPSATVARMDAAVDRLSAALRGGETKPLAVLPFESTKELVTVNVVDEEGSPVPLSMVTMETKVESGTRVVTRPCVKGTCRLPLVPGTARRVLAHTPRSAFGEPLDLAPSNAVAVRPGATEVTVVLPKGRTVAGRIVDQDAKPIAGATLLAQPAVGAWVEIGGPEHAAEATTDAEGAFSLRGVGEGRWALRVLQGGDDLLATPVIFEAGTAPLIVRVKPLEEVVITVVDPEGAALPEIPVRVTHLSIPTEGVSHSTTSRYAQTDTEGKARLRGLDPELTYHISVGEFYGRPSTWVPHTKDSWKPKDTRVVLGRGWSLSLRVVDADGKAIAADVRWRRASNPHTTQGRQTDEDGTLVLGNLPREPLELQILRASNNVTWSEREAYAWHRVEPTDDPVVLSLSTFDRSAFVEVTVLDSEGAPVPKVAAWIEQVDEDGDVRSGRGGEASGATKRFHRPSGPFRLRLFRATDEHGTPFPVGHVTTKTYAQDAQDLVVRMPRGRRFEGVVLTPQGKPLEDAVIRAHPIDDEVGGYARHGDAVDEAHTASDGRFEFTRLSDDAYVVTVESAGGLSAPDSLRIDVTAKSARIITVAPIPLQVIDEAGHPIRNARVRVVRTVARNGGEAYFYPINVRTDAEGRALLRPLDATHALRLEVHAPSQRPALLTHSNPSWNGATGGVITLKQGVVITGTVRLDGKPLAGAYVLIAPKTEGEEAGYLTQADEAGRFRTKPRAPGTLRLLAESPADDYRTLTYRSTAVTVDPSAGAVVLDIRSGQESVRLSAPGVPAGTKGAMILEQEHSDGSVVEFTFEADGETVVRGLLPGTWTVYVREAGQRERCVLVTGQTLPTKTIELPLRTTTTLRCRVALPENATDPQVAAIGPDHSWREASRGPDGVYEVKGMPPGRWRMVVACDVPGGYAEGEAEVGPGETPLIEAKVDEDE